MIKWLFEHGIAVTEKLQQYLLDTAKDIEFRRSSINKDYIPELDAALDSLYKLLHVPPVPKRVELGYEILNNGCINWNNVLAYVQMGKPLSKAELAEVRVIIHSIKNAFEKEMDRLSELAVKWVILNPDLIAVENITYRR